MNSYRSIFEKYKNLNKNKVEKQCLTLLRDFDFEKQLWFNIYI